MNGVSTEDRFQAMTDIQWIMHYRMIVKEEEQDWKNKREIMKTLIDVAVSAASEIAEGSTELLALLIAPERFKVYSDIKNNKDGSNKEEYKDMEDTFHRMIADGTIPLEIEIEFAPSADALTLPVRKRNLGIQKK